MRVAWDGAEPIVISATAQPAGVSGPLRCGARPTPVEPQEGPNAALDECVDLVRGEIDGAEERAQAHDVGHERTEVGGGFVGVVDLEEPPLREAAEGTLSPRVTRYALRDAAAAHQALEARRTVGKVVLMP